MIGHNAPPRQIRLRDYRYPGEVTSLLLTFLILSALYTSAIVMFPKSAAQVWNTLIITFAGLVVYVLTVIIQQRSVFGSLVRVSARQFPEIYEAAVTSAARLSSPQIPVYVKRSSEQNIYTLGFGGQPLIVITSSMIDQMSHESLQFFIGRELGHIRAGHTWLRTLLHPLGSGIPVIGKLLDSVVFGDWMNRSEFTADRAGFIACNSLTVAVSTMIKFGVGTNLFQKLDIREFLEQINDLRSVRGRVTEIVAEQPYLIERVRRLVRFALSKEFNEIAPQERFQTGILEHIPQTFINTDLRNLLSSSESTEVEKMELTQAEVAEEKNGTIEEEPDNSFDSRFKLVATNGSEAHKLRRLQTRIGRNLDNDVILSNDDRISRYHAEIFLQDSKLIIMDCGSRNGVWLNGKKISQKAEVKPNDRLRLGRQEFVFTIEE